MLKKKLGFSLTFGLVFLLVILFAFAGGINPPKCRKRKCSLYLVSYLCTAEQNFYEYLTLTEELWIAHLEHYGTIRKAELLESAIEALDATVDSLTAAKTPIETMNAAASGDEFSDLNDLIAEAACLIQIIERAQSQDLLPGSRFDPILVALVDGARAKRVLGLHGVISQALEDAISKVNLLIEFVEKERENIIADPVEAFQMEDLLRANYTALSKLQELQLAYSGMAVLEHFLLGSFSK